MSMIRIADMIQNKDGKDEVRIIVMDNVSVMRFVHVCVINGLTWFFLYMYMRILCLTVRRMLYIVLVIQLMYLQLIKFQLIMLYKNPVN